MSVSPISQLTAAVMTGSPSTSASQRNRLAATVPTSILTTPVSMVAVATATSWVDWMAGSQRKPM
jgi:hypothetical protein